MDIREAVRGMVALQSTRTPHAWWGVAQALQAVLDSDNDEAITLAETTYNEALGGSK